MDSQRVIVVLIGAAVVLVVMLGFAVLAVRNLDVGGSETGIYRSEDGGTAFEKLTNIRGTTDRTLDITPQKLQFFPQNSDILFTFSQTRGVYRTNDGGDSWQRIFRPEELGIQITTIALHPENPDILYVGARKNGRARIYKTEDNGKTWGEQYVEPAQSARVQGMVVNQDQPQRVTVAMNTGVLLRTENGGEDWTLANNLESVTPRDLKSHPQEPRVLYLTTQSALHVSTDGGRSFERRSWPLESPTAITVNPNGGDQLYVGGEGEMYRSLDRGKTWDKIRILTPKRPGSVQDIAITPGDSRVIYYSVRDVLYFSNDGGEFWRTVEVDINGNVIDRILINPSNRDILYLGMR